MDIRASFKAFTKTTAFRVLLHLGFWGFYLSIPVIQYHSLTEFTNNFVLFTLIVNLIFACFYYPLAYFIVPRFFHWKTLHWFILSTVGLYLLFYLVDFNLQTYFIQHVTLGEQDKKYLEMAHARKAYYLPMIVQMIIVTSIPLSLKFTRRFYRLRDEKTELEKLNVSLQLNYLKAQVNPHFLFNTLNNIYSLALQKSDKSPEMILKLSDLMRYMLYECDVEKTELTRDIQFLQDYIDLEKIRHGEKVKIQFDIQGNTGGHLIPPLLLLPFVENAFKHGVQSQVGDAWVQIDLETTEHSVFFFVKNNKPLNGRVGRSGGIGIENAKQRLQLIYPDSHALHISETGDMYSVSLTLQD
ncbi:MAG: sensor histidine kinase [Chitinophagales bacterium]